MNAASLSSLTLLPPHLHPLQHWRDVFGGRVTTGDFGILALELSPYMFSFTNFFPSLQVFLNMLHPTNHLLFLKWLSQLAECGHLIWCFSYTSQGFKEWVLSSVLCGNSLLWVLKPPNPRVTLLYLSTFIFILPLSIFRAVKRKKINAQVTTEYIFPKKWHTQLLLRWTVSHLSCG